ncbi:hydrophobin-251 [Trametes elegans]|nr:hydrophobin-251 [Trametes elegans]
MVFPHLLAIAISVLPLLAAATPLDTRGGGAWKYATGPLQCCESTEKADSAAGAALLEGLGIVVQNVNVLLGLTCNPITVVGVRSGDSCDAEAVFCQGNSFGGLVSIGCVPVSL